MHFFALQFQLPMLSTQNPIRKEVNAPLSSERVHGSRSQYEISIRKKLFLAYTANGARFSSALKQSGSLGVDKKCLALITPAAK
jgi:hypothetical protein